MERLTTRHNGVAVIKDKSKHKEAMERLAYYEELAEQGRLLELPCKRRDRFWELNTVNGFPHIYPRMVHSLQHCVYVLERLGKTCFLTKAEAEKALEEMTGYNGASTE